MFVTEDDDARRNERELILAILKLNAELIKSSASNQVYKDTVRRHFLDQLKAFKFKKIVNRARVHYNLRRVPKDVNETEEYIGMNELNFFSTHRIAVYTALFGNYDTPIEPVFIPDNCDFFIITENDLPLKNSAWRVLKIQNSEAYVSGMNNTEKNRFFKMHPHIVFDGMEYEYSIYLDSNVQCVGDLTALVNQAQKYPIGMHSHRHRNCVYSEARAAYMLGKIDSMQMDEYLKYLREIKFPKNYGLTECNVIVRKHNDPECIKIMEKWWNLFINGCAKRDQLYFPIALKILGVKCSSVSQLGDNVFVNPFIRIHNHN